MNNALVYLRYGVIPLVIVVGILALMWSDTRIFLGVIILAISYLGFCYIRMRMRLRRLGFRVIHHGRDSIRYDELCGGQLRSIEFGGEMLIGAPHVVYLPPPSTWPHTVPEWARDRRDEIVRRIQQELGTTKYSYE